MNSCLDDQLNLLNRTTPSRIKVQKIMKIHINKAQFFLSSSFDFTIRLKTMSKVQKVVKLLQNLKKAIKISQN